ncbi:hypothetical protein BD310DRAFT_654218 [Dichomitus squalens]|uniref:Uncharacterized protein n=1 Tax=Dichomitus squalens TaxID=114155 RepID=A0A4Q9PNG9_9APHY|nr:hypothetical protein BD310DRAFT_654218 [Dichomitus squalens]
MVSRALPGSPLLIMGVCGSGTSLCRGSRVPESSYNPVYSPAYSYHLSPPTRSSPRSARMNTRVQKHTVKGPSGRSDRDAPAWQMSRSTINTSSVPRRAGSIWHLSAVVLGDFLPLELSSNSPICSHSQWTPREAASAFQRT